MDGLSCTNTGVEFYCPAAIHGPHHGTTSNLNLRCRLVNEGLVNLRDCGRNL